MRRRTLLRRGTALGGAVLGGATGATEVLARPDRGGGDRGDGDRGDGPGRGGGRRRSGAPPARDLHVTGTATGRYFADAAGRVVVLHGVNVGRKTAPYIRPASGFDERDVRRIADWGFNLVRLGVLWAGIEPERGRYDGAYLDRVEELARAFTDHGVHVLVDAHQDLYSHVFDGDGAPEWAVRTDGVPFRRTDPWQADYADPAVARAFDNLWTNTDGLADAYADALGAVAERVHDIRGVVGYELFNEPSPGAETAAGFEDRVLPAFYRRVGRRLRETDATTPLWVEPEGVSNSGKPSTLRDVPDAGAYAFHNYADSYLDGVERNGDRGDAVGRHAQEQVFRNARRTADRLGAVPVLTEFCAGNDHADNERIADLADQYRTGWAYWSYRNWGTRTSGAAGTMVNADGSLGGAVDVVVRPYPRAVGGVPRSWGFDREARAFSLTYAPRGTDRPTVVYVPARQYPDGARVRVDGGQVLGGDGRGRDRSGRGSARGTRGTAGQYVRVRGHPSATTTRVRIDPV